MGKSNIQDVLSGALVAGVIKVLGSGTLFVLHVLIARRLGSEGLGLFTIALAVLAVGAVLGRLGMDNPILRKTSALAGRGEQKYLLSLVVRSLLTAGSLSALLGIVLWITAPFLATHVFHMPHLDNSLRVVAYVLPALASTFILSQVARGLGNIWLSQAVVLLITPLVALIFILIVAVDDIVFMLQGYALGELCALAVALVGVIFHVAARSRLQEGQSVNMRPVLSESLHLYPVMLANIALNWLPALMLGILAGAGEVGMFQSAQAVAVFLSFFLSALNAAAAPRIASLYAQGEIKELASLVQGLTFVSSVIATIMCISIVAATNILLGWFGSEFLAAAGVLWVLLVGHFINLATGPVGFVLMMSGHHREFRSLSVGGLVILVVACAALVPEFGAMGAAIGISVSLSIINVGSLIVVRRKLGFWVFRTRLAEQSM